MYIYELIDRPSKKDIDGRNEWLFNAIELLCGTEKKYSDFKTASAKYRRGTISGNEYYKTCRILLGKRYFSEVNILIFSGENRFWELAGRLSSVRMRKNG